MRAKKTFAAVGVACVSLVLGSGAFAQDDLDNLLNDLEGEQKKPAAAAATKPVEEAKKAEEAAKPEVKAEAAPAPAEAKSAEDAKKAEPEPAAAEAKPAEKAEPVPAVAETKPAEEVKKAEPAPAVAEAKPVEKAEPVPSVAEAKPAEKEEAASAVAEAKPAEDVKKTEDASVVAEAKPAEKAEAKSAEPMSPEMALVNDIVATETLRREAMEQQAAKELVAAREAMEKRDWDMAYKQYSLAYDHIVNNADTVELRKECESGKAKAKYEAGKQALKEGNRELAESYAREARELRHPGATTLIEAMEAEKSMENDTDIADIKHVRNDKKYKMDRDTIRQRLRLSSQYLAVADLNKALEECDLVLRFDPYNQEAIALRDRIQRKRDMVIEKEREATRKGMIADVGAAWRPVYAVDSAELKAIDGETVKTPVGGDPIRSMEQAIEKRMKEMILPSIAFRPPATIIDAVDFFRQASKDYDRPEIPVEQRGFNFVLDFGKALTGAGGEAAEEKKDSNAFGASEDEAAGDASGVPQIPNISASNLSMWEALKLVCKISGFKFKVQGSVVMVIPKNMTTDEMITRSYNVVADFVEKMNDASSGLKNEKAGDFGGGGGDEGGDGNSEEAWKKCFEDMGVVWPQNSRIKYLKIIGKVRVTNTEDNLYAFEQALNEMNVTPKMVEIETRFVEVAQEDLNSLGFEWLLNSDYSFNVGGKVAKALNLKDGWSQQITTGGDSIIGAKYTQLPSGAWEITRGDTGEKTPTTTQGQWTRWNQYVDGNITDPSGKDAGKGNVNPNWVQQWNSTKADDGTITYTPAGGYYNKTGRNMNVNAIDGSAYQTGMRYLSTGDHITKVDGTAHNDNFMRVNAFLGNADLSMILHMLSQRSDTDLLSAPKVVTASGQEATIKVVTIYRFPQDYDVTIQSTSSSSSSSITGGGSGGDGKILPMVEPQNFETMEVGVILTCQPDVTAEGSMINLKLTPKVISEPTWKDYGMKVPMSSVMSEGAQTLAMLNGEDDMKWFTVPMEQPFFKERSIDTMISIYPGATIVMGGLITEERKSMEDKIPFLGDIPFIGRIFRSRSEWSNKRNLLIFVTARLVDPRGREIVPASDDFTSDKVSADVTPVPADK